LISVLNAFTTFTSPRWEYKTFECEEMPSTQNLPDGWSVAWADMTGFGVFVVLKRQRPDWNRSA